jgi:probable phosphoglycerate mutase
VAVFLVRHGETAANAARVLQTPDVPLSPRGLEQARRLAARLSGERVVRILSSDFARAVMTAEQVRDATGAQITLDPLLQERSFGDLRGTPYAELRQDPFAPDFVPPGGESWQALHERVDRAWEQIRRALAQQDGDLVVVTHGLVCRSLVSRHLQVEGREVPLRFRNTSLTVLDAEPPWRVRLLDCIAHLEADARPSPRGGRA